MDVVDGPVDLLAPALDLGDLREILAGEAVLNGAEPWALHLGRAVGHGRLGDHHRGQRAQCRAGAVGLALDQGAEGGWKAAGEKEQLVEAVRAIHARYGQPALVEEFVFGEEVTVGVVDGKVIGAMQIKFVKDSSPQAIYSIANKREFRDSVSYSAYYGEYGELPSRLKEAALASYNALGCCDVARIDFRVRQGQPVFLEANPLPGLDPEKGDLVILADLHGIKYQQLIELIVESAALRATLRDSPFGGEVSAPRRTKAEVSER